jgi:hypothetical protein
MRRQHGGVSVGIRELYHPQGHDYFIGGFIGLQPARAVF